MDISEKNETKVMNRIISTHRILLLDKVFHLWLAKYIFVFLVHCPLNKLKPTIKNLSAIKTLALSHAHFPPKSEMRINLSELKPSLLFDISFIRSTKLP